METHVALTSGVFSTYVDHLTSDARTAEKSLENAGNTPKLKQHGAATFSSEDVANFDRNALLAPVTDRGTMFDLLM